MGGTEQQRTWEGQNNRGCGRDRTTGCGRGRTAEDVGGAEPTDIGKQPAYLHTVDAKELSHLYRFSKESINKDSDKRSIGAMG